MRSLIYSALLALAVQTCHGLCPSEGVQCDDNCNNVILCPSEGAPPTILHTCDNGTFCGTNGTWYDCSHDHCPNPNAPHKFQCLQVGTFPSPYICGKYFICITVNDIPALECVCAEGEYFDIPSQSCKTGTCPRTPVDCKTTGDTGKVENYCYACSETFDAYVYRCNSIPPKTNKIPRAETCGPYSGPV